MFNGIGEIYWFPNGGFSSLFFSRFNPESVNFRSRPIVALYCFSFMEMLSWQDRIGFNCGRRATVGSHWLSTYRSVPPPWVDMAARTASALVKFRSCPVLKRQCVVVATCSLLFFRFNCSFRYKPKQCLALYSVCVVSVRLSPPLDFQLSPSPFSFSLSGNKTHHNIVQTILHDLRIDRGLNSWTPPTTSICIKLIPSSMGQKGSKKQVKERYVPQRLNLNKTKSVANFSGREDLGSAQSRTRANSVLSTSDDCMQRPMSPRTPRTPRRGARGREEEIHNIQQRIKKRLVMDMRQRSSPSLPRTSSSWVLWMNPAMETDKNNINLRKKNTGFKRR